MFYNISPRPECCTLNKRTSLLQPDIKYRRKKFYFAQSWDQIYKTFYNRNLLIFIISYSVIFLQAFPPSLKFVGKARSLPQSEASESFFTWVCSGLTSKHQTMLERLARDKRNSLLQKFVIYGRKKFYLAHSWNLEYVQLFFCRSESSPGTEQ